MLLLGGFPLKYCGFGFISAWTCVQFASWFRVKSMFLMTVDVMYYFLVFQSLFKIVKQTMFSFPFDIKLQYSYSLVYSVKRSVSEALILLYDNSCCLKRTVLLCSRPNSWIKSVISFWYPELKCKINLYWCLPEEPFILGF